MRTSHNFVYLFECIIASRKYVRGVLVFWHYTMCTAEGALNPLKTMASVVSLNTEWMFGPFPPRMMRDVFLLRVHTCHNELLYFWQFLLTLFCFMKLTPLIPLLFPNFRREPDFYKSPIEPSLKAWEFCCFHLKIALNPSFLWSATECCHLCRGVGLLMVKRSCWRLTEQLQSSVFLLLVLILLHRWKVSQKFEVDQFSLMSWLTFLRYQKTLRLERVQCFGSTKTGGPWWNGFSKAPTYVQLEHRVAVVMSRIWSDLGQNETPDVIRGKPIWEKHPLVAYWFFNNPSESLNLHMFFLL